MSDADKKIAEIRERHERDDQWCKSLSILGPQSHEDRGLLLSEIERLRASNESLMNLVEEMQQEARRSFLPPTAMMAFSVILLIIVSFM